MAGFVSFPRHPVARKIRSMASCVISLLVGFQGLKIFASACAARLAIVTSACIPLQKFKSIFQEKFFISRPYALLACEMNSWGLNRKMAALATKRTEVNPNTTIIEDGVVFKDTLTGFEPKANYSAVAQDKRFSDHACILYPEQRIATFNIGMRAIHNPAPGAAQSHKFPMDAAAPLTETDEEYQKRLDNIFNFVKTELFDTNNVDTVVFQEAKAQPVDKNTDRLDNPIDMTALAIFKLDTANTQFTYNRWDELAILSKCNVVFEHIPEILPTEVNTPTTGMTKRPLEERVNTYICNDKKQIIYNLHIPGLNLRGPAVEQRRKNTFTLLWKLGHEFTLIKPEYKDYMQLFIGDFNVPLVSYGNPDIYDVWVDKMVEIHTTPGNESFSYDDHTHGVAPGGNLDCLVVVGGGKKKGIHWANKDGGLLAKTKTFNPAAPIKNDDSFSISTEDRINKGNGNKTNGPEEPPLMTIDFDTTLPTLLRIGNGGKFDEYINLKEAAFKSTGTFTIHSIGGQKELQMLYGVYDATQLRDLQLAFGVKAITDTPPLMAILQKGCKKEYIPTVLQALQERQETLQGELDLMRNTTQKGMRFAFLDVLEALLLDINKLPNEECPSEAVSSSDPVSGAGSGTSGCPCLDDLDLLRDLVVLVVKLLGVASPQVQSQLDAIKLNEILALLDSGNTPGAAAKLHDVVGALSELGEIEETASGEKVQEVLEFIWTGIAPGEPIPSPLTKEIVVDKLSDILETLTASLNTVTAKLATLNTKIAEKDAEIRQLNAQMDALARDLAAATAGSATAAQLATAQTALAEAQAQVAALGAEKEALQKAAEDRAAGNAARNAARTAEFAGLNGQLATAQAAVRTAQETIATLTAELAESQVQTAAADAARAAANAGRQEAVAGREQAEREKQNCESDLERLRAIHVAQGNDLSARVAEVESLTKQKSDLEASIASGNATARNQLRQKDTELSAARAAQRDCEEELARRQAKITELEGQLERQKATIAEYGEGITQLKDRAQTAENERNAAKKAIKEKNTAAEASAAQLAELGAKLAAVQAELKSLTEQRAGVEAELAAQRLQLEQRATELDGIVPALRAEIATLKENLSAAEERAAKASEEAIQVKAELATAKESLEKAKADHARDKEEAETKRAELGVKLRELEGRLRATEEAADAAGQTGSQQAAALATLQNEKENLIAERDALAAKGPEQEAALAAAKKTFETQIRECEEKLAKLEAEKKKELEAQEARHKEELASRNTRIASLQTEIDEAQSAVKAAEEKATGNIAAAQLAANAKVSAAEKAAGEKNAKVKSLEESLLAKEKEKNTLVQNIIAAGTPTSTITNPTLQPIKARLTALQQRLATETTEKAALEGKLQDIAILKESLSKKNEIIQTQKEALESWTFVVESQQAQLKEQEETIQKLTAPVDQSEIDRLARAEAARRLGATRNSSITNQINAINSSITTLQKKLEQTIAMNSAPSEETARRLNTLLSVILVDPELQGAAKEYFTSGNEAELSKLSSKQSTSGILSAELCDFYTYLYGIVSLQYKKLPSRFGDDIFTYFKNPPANDAATTKELLKEIAMLFQAFFIMGETSTIPADLTLSVDVPILSNFLGGLQAQPLKDEILRNAFAREVSGVGFLGQLALIPKEGTQKVVLTKIGANFINEFVEENTKHILPMAVLAVKLIQLLHKDLNEKYKDIRVKCGTVAEFKPEAATATQEGGGLDFEDAIDFEELEL